ncbi:phosphatidylinositol-specific phospholipase C1-like protein [Cytophagaceae bacterium DM2B3-1]|uniref:Phosphatidylinositol-specific phospholipase C1-like protein n=1 Tax=Xanthocytophaga flava TaxID=3048013 RepID=A0ABT7CYV9_9BACT|nr:phosphatidylinositol-specific phospholipase C1-like protein [Xanthocytophaga flavus]MDJ1473627.1 phosphatidylinositol-specific phospholipase C1-like protein [Xanthocytophaga flavus]MDJ1498923.1 phosphatidylinositol-specific phospholipase C1-like protein [Xanthocytophaga flavus]
MKATLLTLLGILWPAIFLVDIDQLPLNQIQVIGSHNSYKQAIEPALFQTLKKADSSLANHIDYSHLSLEEQLNMGLLNLEIDIYADSQGGKYSHPKGLDWAKQTAAYDPKEEMKEPGFKVFHIQEIDFRSHCLTFKNCLQTLKSWSDTHKGHYPIFITINAKDETINKPGFTVPEKFTAEVFDQLDKVLIETLGRDKLLIPDDVRGNHKTLEDAVKNNNWPKVKAAKGKFIFILDEQGTKRTSYIQNHPSLKERILFTNSDAGTPEAAIIIKNNPEKEFAEIQKLVKQGYIVRTRADSDTEQARHNDYSHFTKAQQSGAQIITTDYYIPSTHFKSDYQISFKDKKYIRVNPVKP